MTHAMTWLEMRSERPVLRGTLWVVQATLAAIFGVAGFMALTWPIHRLDVAMQWPTLLPEPVVRFIGGAEILGAIGLVVPAATRIMPELTWISAAGLSLIMILAMLFHASVLDFGLVPLQALLGMLAWYVAWGRRDRAPIAPRTSSGLVAP